MQINIHITDNEKRACRYLNYTQASLKQKIQSLVSSFLYDTLEEAKEKYGKNTPMAVIESDNSIETGESNGN
jgi:hypothetical protein